MIKGRTNTHPRSALGGSSILQRFLTKYHILIAVLAVLGRNFAKRSPIFHSRCSKHLESESKPVFVISLLLKTGTGHSLETGSNKAVRRVLFPVKELAWH